MDVRPSKIMDKNKGVAIAPSDLMGFLRHLKEAS